MFFTSKTSPGDLVTSFFRSSSRTCRSSPSRTTLLPNLLPSIPVTSLHETTPNYAPPPTAHACPQRKWSVRPSVEWYDARLRLRTLTSLYLTGNHSRVTQIRTTLLPVPQTPPPAPLPPPKHPLSSPSSSPPSPLSSASPSSPDSSSSASPVPPPPSPSSTSRAL